MMPAERALEAEHLAIDLGSRLVMQRQLVMSDRRAEIMLQRLALSQMPSRDQRTSSYGAHRPWRGRARHRHWRSANWNHRNQPIAGPRVDSGKETRGLLVARSGMRGVELDARGVLPPSEMNSRVNATVGPRRGRGKSAGSQGAWVTLPRVWPSFRWRSQ
jgi:hypothetical protein